MLKNKTILFVPILFIMGLVMQSQNLEQRVDRVRTALTNLHPNNPGLTETIKTDITVRNISLTNFLMGISDVHKLNIHVSPQLGDLTIDTNLPNVTVSDLLVFLVKEYNLSLDFTGNIISVKPFVSPILEEKEREIPITYNPIAGNIDIDARSDRLYKVFKKIMDVSGKNLVFSPGMENVPITSYIKDAPFDAAMDKMAVANNLYVEKTKDGFYVFETLPSATKNDQEGVTTVSKGNSNIRTRRPSFNYDILNPETKLLSIDLVNVPVAEIIHELGEALDLNMFTAFPLHEAGSTTFRANSIYLDDLLTKIFETSVDNKLNINTNPDSNNHTIQPLQRFTFKKENGIYFFGKENQLSVRNIEVITLMHRSVELLSDPTGEGRNTGRFNNTSNFNTGSQYENFNNRPQNATPQRANQYDNINRGTPSKTSSSQRSILEIIPEDIKDNMEIEIDYELNSLYVNGPSADILRLKQFIHKIDRPVPVVLIEVMIIELNRSNVVETGVEWGLGDAPLKTRGALFPETDLTMGAKTINKIIGSFNDYAGFNLGKVVPNFFATINAMEANGDLKVRSTPKLATLNGHRATFSNGQTSYYAVTQRNIYGTDNPQTSEFTNYYPIDVELGLTIKPSVSSDGQVLLDIFVIQSNFGQRIADDAPPDINSRTFTSIIRMHDQDIAVLGGLEEQYKNNTGSGVPFLARVPLLKWLFSKRKREARKAKLTVLIKPTVIK